MPSLPFMDCMIPPLFSLEARTPLINTGERSSNISISDTAVLSFAYPLVRVEETQRKAHAAKSPLTFHSLDGFNRT
jgi:hypothetical protein